VHGALLRNGLKYTVILVTGTVGVNATCGPAAWQR
jgi:hypothetical protein